MVIIHGCYEIKVTHVTCNYYHNNMKTNGNVTEHEKQTKYSVYHNDGYAKDTSDTSHPERQLETGPPSPTSDQPIALHTQQPTNGTAPSSLFGTLLSWRFAIVLLLLSGSLVTNLPRFGMAMAVVCMVDPAHMQSSTNYSRHESSDYGHRGDNESTQDSIATALSSSTQAPRASYEFTWSTETVGLLLTAPFFTMWASALIMESIRHRLGNRLALGIMIAFSSVLQLLCPMAARYHPYLLVAIAALQGIAGSAYIPVIADTVSWWSPAHEKLLLCTLAYSGFNVCGIVAYPIAGYLCSVPLDNGWPFVFYVFGGFGLIWTVLWIKLSATRPEDHKFVSHSERKFILDNRMGMSSAESSDTQSIIPFKAILTSRPILGYLVAGSCHVVVLQTLYGFLPIFYNSVQGFTVEEAGVLTSGVGVMRLTGNILGALLGTWLLMKMEGSVNRVRKICFCGLLGLAGLLQAMGAVVLTSVDPWVTYGLHLVVLGLQSAAGCNVTGLPLDMAPRYAGFISATFFSVSFLVAMAGPIAITSLTPTNSVSEWRLVWYVISGMFIVASAVFLVFCDASLQPWAQGQTGKGQGCKHDSPDVLEMAVAVSDQKMTEEALRATVS